MGSRESAFTFDLARSIRCFLLGVLVTAVPCVALAADTVSLTEDLRRVTITIGGIQTNNETPDTPFGFFSYTTVISRQVSDVTTALMTATGRGSYSEGDPTEEGTSDYYIRFAVINATHVALTGTLTGDYASVRLQDETNSSTVYLTSGSTVAFEGDLAPGDYYLRAQAGRSDATPFNESEFDIGMALSRARFVPSVPVAGPAATVALAVALVFLGRGHLKRAERRANRP